MKSVLTDIAREAGAIAMRHFRKIDEAAVERKTTHRDLVTFVDKEVEQYTFDRLNREFPDHALIGEESGQVSDGIGGLFILDPIDGTVNYARGLPHFGFSIARKEGEKVTHGLTYLPAFDEMYYAEEGAGASLNGEKIHVSEQGTISDSIVATGFACIRGELKPDGVPIFNSLIYKTRDLRRLGAATADLAYTARGLFEGFYEMGLSPWDVAAGSLLVTEAGGKFTGFAGENNPLSGNKILATNARIHDELQKLIEEALQG